MSRQAVVLAFRRSARYFAALTPITEGAGSLITLSVLALGVYFRLATTAELFTFVFVLVRLAGTFRWVSQSAGQVAR